MRTALFIQCLSVHLPSTPGLAQLAVYYAYTLSLDLIPRLTPASSTTDHVQNAPYNGGESPPPVRCHDVSQQQMSASVRPRMWAWCLR
jgi:hypothetical protein